MNDYLPQVLSKPLRVIRISSEVTFRDVMRKRPIQTDMKKASNNRGKVLYFVLSPKI